MTAHFAPCNLILEQKMFGEMFDKNLSLYKTSRKPKVPL